MKRALLLFLLAAFITSCSTIQELRFQEPEIEFKGFQFDQISMEGVTILFDFEVDNPNNRSIKGNGYTYELLLGESSLATGERAESIEFAGNDKSIIQVPVTFAYRDAMSSIGELAGEDSVAYEIKSEIDLDFGNFGSRKTPVSHQGYLPLPQIPDIVFNGFDVNEIGFSGVDVNLNFRVRNPNIFKIYVNSVDYTMIVNGNEWVSTGIDKSYDLDSETNTYVDVPIKIGLSTAGTDAIQVIRDRKPVEYEIRGHARVGADIPGFSRDADLPFEFKGTYEF